MKIHPVAWFLIFCAAAAVGPCALTAQDQGSTPAGLSTPLVYRNTQYGFCFRLPADWKGYTIVTQQWQGTLLTGDAQGPAVSGPELLIRNPNWTKGDPWQDIPIMIFTPSQWKIVAAGNMAVSAAPIGPAELGENENYVFALPPRWIGFYDVKGIDEVQALMSQNPFESPCGHKSTQPITSHP